MEHHSIVDSYTVTLSDRLHKEKFHPLQRSHLPMYVSAKFRNSEKRAEWRDVYFKYSYPFCFNYMNQLTPFLREKVMMNVTQVCISIELVSDTKVEDWALKTCMVEFPRLLGSKNNLIEFVTFTDYRILFRKELLDHGEESTNYDDVKAIAFYVNLGSVVPGNIRLNWQIQFVSARQHTFYYDKCDRQRILSFSNVGFTFAESGFKRKQRLLAEELESISVGELDEFFKK